MDVEEGFAKFKRRLEITETEEQDAIRRRDTLCHQLSEALEIDHNFLTGSYSRHTKTKPLKDVDIFVVMRDGQRGYLQKRSDELLAAFGGVLGPIYGDNRFSLARHSVRIDFGRLVVDDVTDGVMSFDIVPAFVHEQTGYSIPDSVTGKWIRTNPKVHEQRATAANVAFQDRWKPAVKMIKKWNDRAGQPIKPSFLLEVMALDLLDGPFESYAFDVRQFFASASEAIGDAWPDPARLGPDVSDRMTSNPSLLANGRRALKAAEAACTTAMRHEAGRRIGSALDIWQELFGPLFAKS